MKYAILADIHANLEALHTVLCDAKEQACTHHALLGDFVVYGADPKACLDIVRAMNAPCVKGNCDEYSATSMPLHGFNASMIKAVEWTRQQLTDDDRRWLNKLPHVRTVEDFTVVHATLDDPERWGYVFDRLMAASSFTHQKTQLCFFGHTHVPVTFVRDNTVRCGTYTKFKVEPDKKYFVNVGSVGQPRDGNPKAAYAIYHMDQSTVELRRIEYDIVAAQRKIRDAGLGP